jgi:hypothetical protein
MPSTKSSVVEVKMRDLMKRLLLGVVSWMVMTLPVMPGGAMAQDKRTQSRAPADSWTLKTGNDYLGWCSTALNGARLDDLFCLGYMRGLLTGINSSEAAYKAVMKQPPLICVPATAKLGQLMKVSLKYLNDNPAELHFPLGDLIMASWFRITCHATQGRGVFLPREGQSDQKLSALITSSLRAGDRADSTYSAGDVAFSHAARR